jgi:hypothetical protein
MKIDTSVNLALAASQREYDGTENERLIEQARSTRVRLADQQRTVDAAAVKLEEAKAALAAAEAAVAKTTSELAVLKPGLAVMTLRHELAKERDRRRSMALKHTSAQTTHNFEYRRKGSTRHCLHVSFRQLNRSPGSKDWKALPDLAEQEKLAALEHHKFPFTVEAEIGPSTGPSFAESQLTAGVILEKLEQLQDEAFSYIECSVSFKHDGDNDPDVLVARRHQFRAYIDLEKDNCEGPFKCLRAWLKDRQKLARKIAALFVCRNETQLGTLPCGRTSGCSFLLNGLGVLYLCDDDPNGEMVCLQVKREYSGQHDTQ